MSFTHLLQLKKFPNIPVTTQEEHRGPAKLKRSPVSASQLEMRVSSPVSSGKDSCRFCRISRGGALKRKVERNSRGHASISKFHQMSQSTPEEPDFHALPRLSRRGSTHTTVARVTALWEMFLKKPRGKATDPNINTKKSLTLLLQLGRKKILDVPT